MRGKRTSKQRNLSTRLLVNSALFVVVCLAGWLGYAEHLKPHFDRAFFGGVTVVAVLGVLMTLIKAVKVDEAATNVFRRALGSSWATLLLGVLAVLLGIGYSIIGTVYLKASDGGVRLTVIQEGREPKRIVLDDENKERAITVFPLLRPTSLTVHTDSPIGFADGTIEVRRAWPKRVTVPDLGGRKAFHIVRLIPGDHLFGLRGRPERDPFYTLRVLVPGQPPIVREGLRFKAVYLGASEAELRELTKALRDDVLELRAYLGQGVEAEEQDRIIAELLDDPEFIATPDLSEETGAKLELLSDGKPTTTESIDTKDALKTVFLKGAPR